MAELFAAPVGDPPLELGPPVQPREDDREDDDERDEDERRGYHKRTVACGRPGAQEAGWVRYGLTVHTASGP